MLSETLRSPLVAGLLAAWTIVASIATLWLPGRLRRGDAALDEDIIRRVLRNSAIPIASQLLIRAIDLGIAILLLRLLGPEGNGQYAIAVIVWLYAKTLSDFGLGLIGTRDVALDPTAAGRIVGATTLFRLLILLLVAVPVGAYVALGLLSGSLSTASVLAIALLYASIVPSSYTEAVNAAINGLERMADAAALNVGVSLARAPLVVLLAATRLEVVGVALAAFATACLSAAAYRRAFRLLTGQLTRWSLGRVEAGVLARRSWPLLLNALLVSLFFRADVFIVQAARGDEALGIYDAAYKLINLVTIVPAYVTLAIFPALAVRAGDPQALARAGRAASYLLVWIAWSIVVVVSATGETAIRLLAGDAYLPDAALLLRILIWFAPLSFLNGTLQYVLVAAEQQRRIVLAFGAAVAFNLLANLALVPAYGARAAAVTTVATELVILGALLLVTRGGPVTASAATPGTRLWRPSLAGICATAVALLTARSAPEPVSLVAAGVVFLLVSLAAGVFGAAERDLLRRALRRRPAAST